MATLNLTKAGGNVLIEFTGEADRLVGTNALRDFYMPSDGTSNVYISIAGKSYSLAAITDLQIAGVAVTNQADFLTKIATVFPDTNSGTGGTGATTLEALPDGSTRFAMTTAQKDFLNALMGVDNP
jgi:hypothetical protein